MAKKNKKQKTFYYRDPVNDDFANAKLEPEDLPEDYKYVNKHKWFWPINQCIRAIFFFPILRLVCLFAGNAKIINHRQVKKAVKGKGYFLYANHTSEMDPVNHAVLVNPVAFTTIIASTETFSLKGLAGFIHFLGAIPVPSSPTMYRNFHDALKFHIEMKHKVLIYPEAHIWPYYTGIRPFKSVSFRYPVEFDAPIVVATTTYKKRKWCKIPKTIITLSGPIYPNKDLKFKDRIQDLRDRTYQEMVKVADTESNYAKYNYVKVED